MADSSTLKLPSSLIDALIPLAPPSTYYIPNFLTPQEETYLLQKINSVPLPTWRHLSHRRLQAHPSPLTTSNTLLDAPLPPWLQEPIISRILSLLIDQQQQSAGTLFSTSPHKTPNHCLINEYTPGQGISPHEDGSAYHPTVATVSLGTAIVLDVYRKPRAGVSMKTVPEYRILQEPRSLLISTGEMYTDYLHGIAGVDVDEGLNGGEEGIANFGMLGEETREQIERAEGSLKRGTRVSLTFRDVVKVKKVGFLSMGKK